NSQDKIVYGPSWESSSWLTPPQLGVLMELLSAMVWGSRRSSRFRDSATTIAALPSGMKYMLYGSSTGMDLPGLPVMGSMGVTLPSFRCSALLFTQSVFRSQEG